MVKKCSVIGCRSESFKNCGITFFRIPKSRALRRLWAEALPIKVTNHSVICHLHFRNEDIVTASQRSRLKSNAIPRFTKRESEDEYTNIQYLSDSTENMTTNNSNRIEESMTKEICLSVVRDRDSNIVPLIQIVDGVKDYLVNVQDNTNNPNTADFRPKMLLPDNEDKEKIRTLRMQVKALKQCLRRRDKKIKQLEFTVKMLRNNASNSDDDLEKEYLIADYDSMDEEENNAKEN